MMSVRSSNFPVFSVVVPVHNKAAHIRRSLESVITQGFRSFELIVIDDASTDDSLQRMEEFDDERIRIFRRDEPGPGGYAARNLGIRKAKSDWIAFLDADDQWLSDHLSRYEQLIRHYPAAEVLGAGYMINENVGNEHGSNVCSYYQARCGWGVHELSFSGFLQAETRGLRPIWTSVAAIKRTNLLKVGGFPEARANRGGDVETWLRCVAESGHVIWSPHIGAIYHRDSDNMVTRTEPFWAQVERDTVGFLLQKAESDVRSLLKRFANRRTIAAFRKNAQLKSVRNFFLPTKLYWSVDLGTNVLWAFLSLLPRFVFARLESLSLMRRRRATTR